MAIDAERIALIVELATRDAKESLGRELAAYDAQLALNRAFGNNRRWLGLSDRLVKAGRSFIDELAMRIRAIDAGSDAMAIYSKAVESFAGHLDHIFHDHWAKDAPWRRNKDAPPPTVWQSEKNQLELALKVQQAEFGSEPASAGQRAKGPQWKRFDEAVNLVAWLLTSPKAPTDYGSAGATNLARLVREAKVRCRGGSITNVRGEVAASVDAASPVGQDQLRLVTGCLADALVQGSRTALTEERTRTFDLMAKIRKSPQSFPPAARELLKASDKATGTVGKGEDIARAYIGFAHAFDTLDALHGTTDGKAWRMIRADRDTSSFSFDFYQDGIIIDVLGLQFSYSDMWSALGEEADNDPPRSDDFQPGDAPSRAPSVKAGRPPSDDEILAKADEMKASGLDGRTIAKSMRLEPGFENVATTAVRELIKGRWRPEGRPKKAA